MAQSAEEIKKKKHEYYLANKEKWKTEYYDQDKHKVASQKYVATHPEKRKETSAKSYQKHKEAKAEYTKEWYKKNKHRKEAKRKELYQQRRERFFEMYGDKCACCGYDDRFFLVLDHIQGQRGRKRAEQSAAYRDAIEKYQPKKYRTLCHNCNFATRFGDECPHQRRN